MNTIDLTPLYRSYIGFDRLANLIDTAMRGDTGSTGYPPYDIESLDENQYAITLAVAGFDMEELDITVEKGVLTIRGRKNSEKKERRMLYQGIANRAFERKFNLADFVEVTGANLHNGLLTITLVREIPDAMKPKTITIETGKVLEHRQNEKAA